MVYEGDVIVLNLNDTSFLEPNPELSVPVVFENDSLVVFDKPAGMPVHPSIHHQGDTLGNCFAAMYPELTFRPVSRLDRDTSGLCIAAKNAHAAKPESVLRGGSRGDTRERNYQCSHSARAGEHNSPMCPRGRTRCRYPLQAYLMQRYIFACGGYSRNRQDSPDKSPFCAYRSSACRGRYVRRKEDGYKPTRAPLRTDNIYRSGNGKGSNGSLGASRRHETI